MSKRKTSGVSKTQTISKYFRPETSKTSVSPYKDNLTEIKSTKNLEDDDFKTPPVFNKVSKLSKKKTPQKKNSRRKVNKTSKVTSVKNFFKDTNLDVNPDHLQLALALSESEQSEHSKSSNIQLNDSLANFRQALEQFGLKCGKQQFPVQKRRVQVKRKQKSKYRFITPILDIRTEEERESLISKKISEILERNTRRVVEERTKPNLFVFSEKLEANVSLNRRFDFAGLSLDELNEPNRFYVKTLDIEPCMNTCGSLLKNWADIKGREKSPERTIKTEQGIVKSAVEEQFVNMIDQENTSESHENAKSSTSPVKMCNKNVFRCYSPDLFESDHDLSNVINDKAEIETCDLTQSSGDENIEDKFMEPTKFESNNVSADSTIIFDTFRNCDSSVNIPNNENEDKIVNCHFESNMKSPVKLSTTLLANIESDKKASLSKTQDEDDEFLLKKYQSSNLNSAENIFDNHETAKSPDYTLKEEDKQTTSKSSRHSLQSEKSQEFNSSQESIVISDDELNYSSMFSTPLKTTNKKSSKYDLSIFEDLGCSALSPLHEMHTEFQYDLENNHVNSIETTENVKHSPEIISNDNKTQSESPIRKIDCFDDSLNVLLNRKSVLNEIEPVPSDDCKNIEESTKTPDDKGFIVKTKNITPMLNYDCMNTPKLTQELDKYGLKPLKRTRGVQLLKYIYESTHPVVDRNSSDEECEKVAKKRKTEPNNPQENTKEQTITNEFFTRVETVGNIVKESDELIFERTTSKRIHSCRVPLQIAWYNFLSCNPQIKESILLYEPLQVEVVHTMLKEQGFKYNIQDVVTFLDRHCITIRTCQGQNQGRRKKK